MIPHSHILSIWYNACTLLVSTFRSLPSGSMKTIGKQSRQLKKKRMYGHLMITHYTIVPPFVVVAEMHSMHNAAYTALEHDSNISSSSNTQLTVKLEQ